MEKRAGAQQQRKRAAEPPPRVIIPCAEKSSFEPVSSKMANMILHENDCDGTSRESAKHRTCPPAGCALETAAPVRAALTDTGLNFLAFPGSRRAEPSAGFTR
jgi:hypothetical protein